MCSAHRGIRARADQVIACVRNDGAALRALRDRMFKSAEPPPFGNDVVGGHLLTLIAESGGNTARVAPAASRT
jgi:hypothetical protein